MSRAESRRIFQQKEGEAQGSVSLAGLGNSPEPRGWNDGGGGRT